MENIKNELSDNMEVSIEELIFQLPTEIREWNNLDVLTITRNCKKVRVIYTTIVNENKICNFPKRWPPSKFDFDTVREWLLHLIEVMKKYKYL